MAAEKRRKEPKDLRKAKQSAHAAARATPGAVLLVLRAVAVLAVFSIGHTLASNGAFASEVDQKMSILARLFFFMVAHAVANEFFALVMLQVARRLLGDGLALGAEMTPEEKANNDSSIAWPQKDLLSPELRAFADRKGQPFCLNHVTGRRRFKDALMRFGMTVGSVVAVWCTCTWMDKRSLASLGLTLDTPFFRDAACGLAVGVAIVTFMFAVELSLGWVQFLQFFEVFDRSESFVRCILWDVIFHLNVALNEELPVRGWMLYALAESLATHFGLRPIVAFVTAMVAESAFFVAMHLQSPGGTELKSMLNIFVGGMAGGLNVLFTGGRLGFSLGWHFGWNISMGNVFGMSTSGIPISATFVSVAPHPEKAKLHGGVFGPEGGVVSPFAYGLGIILLALIYGLPAEVVSPSR
mmetsp:Transcript_105449/g.264004  ORF Transcript_105449/g.264004 Transcript_105449/m.264004 type:complete len:412 (+) Transcript_105449:266-1501(+)